jgi:malate dehydrogenase
MAANPITVTITGAAGQIGYSLIPMIARGNMFGENQPVILKLVDLPFMQEALGGVAMEIEDGFFPLVRGVVLTDDPLVGFEGSDAAVLLGAFPRKQGMERKDLMEKNVGIFKTMGEAIEKVASKDIKVLIVGNPANTNCLICSHYAPSVPKTNFTALTRLDHNRAMGQVALHTGANVNDVKNVIIWGNHSSTQYPDVNHGTIAGKPIKGQLKADYLEGEFVKTVQTRGAKIIDARKASSALSAAKACSDHMNNWFNGTKPGEFVSMGIFSSGNPYGVSEGIIYSMPCECANRTWTVKGGLPIDAFSQGKMKATAEELADELALAMSLL